MVKGIPLHQSVLLIIISAVTQFPFAQEIQLNQAYADSIRQVNSEVGEELRAIAVFNQVVKSFGFTDTVEVRLSTGQYRYTYKDTPLQDFSFDRTNPKHPFMLSYSGKDRLTQLSASLEQSPSKGFEVAVRPSPGNVMDLVYTLTLFEGGVKKGRYEERTPSGITLIRGQYCQVDTQYIDTITYFDPVTFDESIMIESHTKFAVKSGTWYYYSPEGILMKEEVFEGCE